MYFSNIQEAYEVMTVGKFQKMYFVDVTNGDDTYDGLTPDRAFATIAQAVNTCKALTPYGAHKMDYIFIAPGLYPEKDIIQEGHGTHIIGTGIRGADSGVRVIPAVDPTYCLLALQCAHVEVANIYFYSGYTDPCIWSPNHMDNTWIHDCTFAGLYSTTLDCLKFLNTRGSVIENNIITGFKEKGIHCYNEADAYLIDTIIRNNLIGPAWDGIGSGAKGIFVGDQVLVYTSVIDRNHINMCGAAGAPIGIDIDATTRSGGLQITDNYVAMAANRKTTAITCALAISGILGNHVSDTTVATDPFPATT